VHAEPVAGAVGAEADDHPGLVNPLQIAAVQIEERVGRIAGRRPLGQLLAKACDGGCGQRFGEGGNLVFGFPWAGNVRTGPDSRV